MAFIQSTSTPRLARISVIPLFQGSADSLFCYGAFTLSVGFTVALMFGLIP